MRKETREILIFSAGAVAGSGVVLYGTLRILCIPSVTRFLGEAFANTFADWVMNEPRSRRSRRVPYHEYSARPETTEVE